MFLNDQETATDLLYYESIAKTVVKLIRESSNVPITVGVHGDWGAGKSSVLKMTEAAFTEDEKVLCLWFNGWTFEGFEDAKAVVIETIVDELRRKRPASTKVADAARKVLKRVDWLKLAKTAGGLALTATTGIPTFDQLNGLISTVGCLVARPQDTLNIEDIKSFAEKAKGYIKDAPTDSDNVPEQIHAFRKEFKELIDAAEIEQLIVIVDDLDRCLPKTAIATLESIRLFLFVEGTAFIIGADEMMIEYAVREHFPDLPQNLGPVSYARNYLEKLIQVPFRIPALGFAETSAYITLLLTENAVGASDEKFTKLLAIARENMKRPWVSQGLNGASISTAFQNGIPQEISQAQMLSAHVAKILSEGTRGNPRQIKRFLNSMMLRHAIADERGFGSDIQRPVLAKIMLAETFAPDFYKQIALWANSAQAGKPSELKFLEEYIRIPANSPSEQKSQKGKAGTETTSKQSSVPKSISEDLESWAKNDWIKGWILNEPSLINIDLRPYVFATRDKQNYLANSHAASPLDGLVEKLMGSGLAVSTALPEVRALCGTQPKDAFAKVCERIQQTDEYGSEPKGIKGLCALVASFPDLQSDLLSFLRSLPIDKLGSWAATSCGNCFTETHIASAYTSILNEWSGQSGNTILKAAANGALKVKKG